MDLFLETERLILREEGPEHQESLHELMADPESQEFILRAQRQPNWSKIRADHLARDREQHDRGAFSFVILRKVDSEIIGFCSLNWAWERSAVAGIGWHIPARYSGHGYATESGEALLRFAFEERRVFGVVAECFQGNKRVQKVLAKLGMPPIRMSLWKWLRRQIAYREFRPIILFGVHRDTWSARARRAGP